MICVSLIRGDERVGVPNVTSGEVPSFSSADEASLAGLAHFVSSMIGAAIELASCTAEFLGPGQVTASRTLGQRRLGGSSEAARARSTFVADVVRSGTAFDSIVRDRIEQVLTGSGLIIVLQPIVSLPSGTVITVEALARCAAPLARGPDRWCAEAASVGLGHPLELGAIEHALDPLPDLPDPLRVPVTAGPDTFCSTEPRDLLRKGTPSRVVVELSEHICISYGQGFHLGCPGSPEDLTVLLRAGDLRGAPRGIQPSARLSGPSRRVSSGPVHTLRSEGAGCSP